MNARPSALPAAASWRATSAEAVVWSTKIAPDFMPAKAPCSPSTTERRSLSLPTQQKTMSAPAAASFGVGALAWPYSSTHWADLAAERL